MNLINLTPHRIAVIVDGETIASFPPDGRFARLQEIVEPTAALDCESTSVPTVLLHYGREITDLPEPEPGTAYIASRITAAAAAAAGRADMYFPFGEVRDSDGRVIGCRALGTFGRPGQGEPRDRD